MLCWTGIDRSMKMGAIPRAQDKKPAVNNNQDTSAYDALVSLAQPWVKRYPLIDFHGNCGSAEGDGPAAMRYTECRLSKIGASMMEGIKKDGVKMVPNYDGTAQEPTVLSGIFPNLICNGTSGIATGLASTTAPHYAEDVFKAIKYVFGCMKEKQKPSIDEAIKLIKAPDFPTGGIIINPDEIQQGYRDGHGRVIIRGRYEIEEDKKGNQTIVLTEFPYNVRKSSVVARIGQLAFEEPYDAVMHDNIQNIIDESGKGKIRVAIKLKKGANADLVVNNLFVNTAFQSSFSFNNTILVDGRPIENVNILQMLEAYCLFQCNVKRRVTKFDLIAFTKRLEIVEGFLKANEDIDAIIKCIRASEDHDAVIRNLMEQFDFTEAQAKAIDARRLGSLNKMDSEKLQQEATELEAKIARCKDILTDNKILVESIEEDIDAYIARGYFKGDKRRTSIEAVSDSIENRDLIQEENIVMACTHNGMWKAMKVDDYNAQNRNGKGVILKLREDDFVEKLLFMSNMDDILVVTNKGRLYVVPAYRVPIVSRTAMGKYLTNYITLQDDETVVNVLSIKHGDTSKDLVFVSKEGYAKRLQLEGLTVRKSGINVCKVEEGDEIVSVLLASDEDNIICATHDGFDVNTSVKNLPVQGRQARGVILIRFKSESDYIVSTLAVNSDDTVIVMSTNGYGKRIDVKDIPVQKGRGNRGSVLYKPDEKFGSVASVLRADDEETIFVCTTDSMIVRVPAADINKQGRSAHGVKVVSLNDGAFVQSAVIGPAESEEGDADDAE